ARGVGQRRPGHRPTLQWRATDLDEDGAWHVARRPDGPTWRPGSSRADCPTPGPAQALPLTLTRRPPLSGQDSPGARIVGDSKLARHWIDNTPRWPTSGRLDRRFVPPARRSRKNARQRDAALGKARPKGLGVRNHDPVPLCAVAIAHEVGVVNAPVFTGDVHLPFMRPENACLLLGDILGQFDEMRGLEAMALARVHVEDSRHAFERSMVSGDRGDLGK